MVGHAFIQTISLSQIYSHIFTDVHTHSQVRDTSLHYNNGWQAGSGELQLWWADKVRYHTELQIWLADRVKYHTELQLWLADMVRYHAEL